MKMNRIVLSFIAALAGALPLVPGCAGDSDPADKQATGTAMAAVTNVPNGVGCVVITATGTWTTSQATDVVPGQNVTISFPVPVGTVAFSGAAYAGACSQVTPASIPSWTSASVLASVQAGQTTVLTLNLMQSGAAGITVGFTPPPSCSSNGVPCFVASECCSGYCASDNTCQPSPGLPGMCPAGLTPCSTNPTGCADLMHDPQNCGACGVFCGPGAVCSNGACVGGGGQCMQPSDCPPSPNFCQLATCNGGVCGYFNAPAGTVLPQQNKGDCADFVCDGNGNTFLVPNATDVPADDGNPCTFETCSGPVPVHPPLPDGSFCPGGVCMAGACMGAATCTDAIKNGSETDIDCGGGSCPPCLPGKSCVANTDCLTNACDALFFACVPDQCADHHQDGTETDLDCGGGTCMPCNAGRKCNTNTDCASNACAFGICM